MCERKNFLSVAILTSYFHTILVVISEYKKYIPMLMQCEYRENPCEKFESSLTMTLKSRIVLNVEVIFAYAIICESIRFRSASKDTLYLIFVEGTISITDIRKLAGILEPTKH